MGICLLVETVTRLNVDERAVTERWVTHMVK